MSYLVANPEDRFSRDEDQLYYMYIFFLLPFFRAGKRPRGRAVSAPDFGSLGRGFEPAGGEILPEPKRRFIAQSLSCSPFHRLEMTEILLKRRKTLTHPYFRAGSKSGLHPHTVKIL